MFVSGYFLIFVMSSISCDTVVDDVRKCLEFDPLIALNKHCGKCNKCFPGTYTTPEDCGFCKLCNTCIDGNRESSSCLCDTCLDPFWGDHCQHRCDHSCNKCEKNNGSSCIEDELNYRGYSADCTCADFVTPGMCGHCYRCVPDYYVHSNSCGTCLPCLNCIKGPNYKNNCTCADGCDGFYWGEFCDQKCYSNCSKCDQDNGYICHDEKLCNKCKDSACFAYTTGKCARGCKPGFSGDDCNICSANCKGQQCDIKYGTGKCLDGCNFGYTGEYCNIHL